MEKEIVNIEEYAKAGKPIPKDVIYRIRIDKEKYDVDVPEMTGLDLLLLAGKMPPDRYNLYQKLKGGQTKKIEPDEYADFTAPGVERFMTLPLDQTEGYSGRRHFQPIELDEEYLNTLGFSWEAVLEKNVMRVVIYEHPVPLGYNVPAVDLSVRLSPGYPDAQIDMVYFHPHLARLDGRPIKAISNDQFDGKVWQRWSRHRTSKNPWRPGVDYLGTHIALVKSWLERELNGK